MLVTDSDCDGGSEDDVGDNGDGGDGGDDDGEIEKQRKWEITGESFDQKLLMRLWGV